MTYLHGVEIVTLDQGQAPVKTLQSSVIGVVGTANDADTAVFPAHQPVLVTASEVGKIKAIGGSGTLPTALQGIFDQCGATVVVVRVEDSLNDAEAALANLVGNEADMTGLYALRACEQLLQVTPRLLCVPGASAEPIVQDVLAQLAESCKAIAIIDGPNQTIDAAMTLRARINDNKRLYLIEPHVQLYHRLTHQVETIPASPIVAGLIARIDHAAGFWHSPSNQVIHSILGAAKPIDFYLGDPHCLANRLNAKQIATIVHQNGYRLWGNRVCSETPPWQFITTVRTKDIIDDSIQKAHLWAVDRNITRNYMADVTESVNSYLRDLTSMGAILGGQCYLNPDKNPLDSIREGKLCFDVEFAPPVPAEHIRFESHINDQDYLVNIL